MTSLSFASKENKKLSTRMQHKTLRDGSHARSLVGAARLGVMSNRPLRRRELTNDNSNGGGIENR
jgi:hypothetical protein